MAAIANSQKKKRRQKEKTENAELSLERIIQRLLVDIRSVQSAQEQASETLLSNISTKADEFSRFVEKFSKSTRGSSQRQLQIPIGKTADFKKLIRELTVAANSLSLSMQASLLVLVSKWDAFMGSMLRWVYTVQPAIINASERSIAYIELLRIGDLKSAREKIIDDELSSVLRDGHIAHFDYLEKKLKVSLRSDLDIWPAPGSEDTELGVLMEPEVDHGEAEVYARVQA
jgi:hypothetical protein